ncbi:hypothetical protein N0V90_000390 [Kalmusia sp. IMI 367209]|nr:hypothetical protein N0V90_000390 [Kalmusia sp. IMI 367209]
MPHRLKRKILKKAAGARMDIKTPTTPTPPPTPSPPPTLRGQGFDRRPAAPPLFPHLVRSPRGQRVPQFRMRWLLGVIFCILLAYGLVDFWTNSDKIYNDTIAPGGMTIEQYMQLLGNPIDALRDTLHGLGEIKHTPRSVVTNKDIDSSIIAAAGILQNLHKTQEKLASIRVSHLYFSTMEDEKKWLKTIERIEIDLKRADQLIRTIIAEFKLLQEGHDAVSETIEEVLTDKERVSRQYNQIRDVLINRLEPVVKALSLHEALAEDHIRTVVELLEHIQQQMHPVFQHLSDSVTLRNMDVISPWTTMRFKTKAVAFGKQLEAWKAEGLVERSCDRLQNSRSKYMEARRRLLSNVGGAGWRGYGKNWKVWFKRLSQSIAMIL